MILKLLQQTFCSLQIDIVVDTNQTKQKFLRAHRKLKKGTEDRTEDRSEDGNLKSPKMQDSSTQPEPNVSTFYNPITPMGFLAMFTFQLDNTKR